MIHIEGEVSGDGRGSSPPAGDLPNLLNKNSSDEAESDDDSQADEEVDGDPDTLQDNYAKGFLKDLLKVGQSSKQILNYSYPPLLYQRGDDSQEEFMDGESGDGESSEEEGEEASHS